MSFLRDLTGFLPCIVPALSPPSASILHGFDVDCTEKFVKCLGPNFKRCIMSSFFVLYEAKPFHAYTAIRQRATQCHSCQYVALLVADRHQFFFCFPPSFLRIDVEPTWRRALPVELTWCPTCRVHHPAPVCRQRR